MFEEETTGAEGPVVRDPWADRPLIPLDGPLERQRFPPWLTAAVALFVGMILFNVIGSVAFVVLLLLRGVDPSQMMADLPALLETESATFLIGNSLGQILGLGLLAALLARLHSSRPAAFLRLRRPDAGLLLLGLFGLVALMPLVQWLGEINQSLPLPESLRSLDEMMQALIERLLGGNVHLAFSLAMVAVTPALFEELFFRGYFQRQMERSTGVGVALFTTGLLFGLFHLNLTQVLPLTVLGVYLAYLAWRTGSLWVPVAVHFANNAFAVVTVAVVSNRPDFDTQALDQVHVPWYIASIGLVVFGGIVYGLQRRAADILVRTPASARP